MADGYIYLDNDVWTYGSGYSDFNSFLIDKIEHYNYLRGEYGEPTKIQNTPPYKIWFSSGMGEYHYACYDVDAGEYIDGFSDDDDNTSTNAEITRPDIDGYTYQGYVYYDSFDSCVEQIESGGNYDSTGTTVDLDSDMPYVVFFYSGGGGGGGGTELNIAAGELIPVTVYIEQAGWYTFYTEGDYDTYGYLTNASVSGTISSEGKLKPDGEIIGEGDDIDYPDNPNFSIYAYLSAGAYKVWVRFYSVSTHGTVTLCVEPKRPTFYGEVWATGKNTAAFYALFENGDGQYANKRYVRLKLNGTWKTSYIASSETGGAKSTFDYSAVNGLSPNTVYQYELHLYSYSYGSYVDSGYYISGSFKTDESGTGFMIDVGDQFKNAEIWIDNGSTWERYYSNLDDGSTWHNA